MKRLVVRTGYETYVLSEADAVTLAAISMRAIHVKQENGYSGAYRPLEEQTPMITGISVEEVAGLSVPVAQGDEALT